MLFKDELEFLGNFYASKLVWRGTNWPTVEHAFQAAKCAHPEDEEDIRNANTPGLAKKIGREVLLRPDWERVKVDVMTDLVKIKFDQHPLLAEDLLVTDDEYLEEGNYWHDNFWGDCYCSKCVEKEGKNVLGIILMEIRKSIMDDLS